MPSDVKWAWPDVKRYLTPVECDAADIQFVIVLGTMKVPSYKRTELKKIFKGKKTEFYSVRGGSIYRYKITKNGIKETAGHPESGTSILQWEPVDEPAEPKTKASKQKGSIE